MSGHIGTADHVFGNLPFIARRIRAGGVDLTLVEGPDTGPPLVLLAGMLDRWTGYEAVLPLLGPHFRILLLEHRGHGTSGYAPGGDYRVIDYANDVVSLIEEEVRDRTLISGNSLGGMIALNVAARRPDLVQAIAIEDAPLLIAELPNWPSHWLFPFFGVVARMLESWRATGADVENLAGRIRALPLFRPRLEQSSVNRAAACGKVVAGMRDAGLLSHDEAAQLQEGWRLFVAGERPTMGACLPRAAIRAIARDWATVDPRVPFQAADGRLSEDFDHAACLAAVRCPLLLWEADRDVSGIVPPSGFERLKACLSHVPHRHVYAEGAGHQIHRDAPRLFASQTTDFFRLVGPAGQGIAQFALNPHAISG